MTWHLTSDVDEFLAMAGDWLRARPVENTVLLTIADTLRQRGPTAYGDTPPQFGWWSGGGAFLRTPPRGAILSAMPPAAVVALVPALARTTLPSVTAPDAVADAFVREWYEESGSLGRVLARNRLYRLAKLIPPVPPASGAARIADKADRDLLLEWMTTFQREIGEQAAQTAEFIDDKLTHGGLALWEDAGRPVSMAGLTRAQAGMVRVQAVYTPRDHRGKGYAGAVTTAVSQAALDAGAAEVVLFTDLANPTSNALYQRLGYTPVDDRTTVEFPHG